MNPGNRVRKRHLVILFAVCVFVRAFMMASFPLTQAPFDDNQAAQRYLIDQLIHGNPLIGNIRYQIGYPLAIAPVVSATQGLKPFDDRVVLAVQVALSALIPFMVYDILRRQTENRQAFVVALVVALDPFGLQAPHFWLPEWWVAFCLIAALWLISLLPDGRHRLLIAICAGILLGVAALSRLNAAPLALLVTFSAAFLGAKDPRQRLVRLGTVSISALITFGALLLAFQVPSVGSLQVNCISGINQTEALAAAGLAVSPDNGPASTRLTDLLTRTTPEEVMMLSSSYPNWRLTGPWATPEEQRAFLNQIPGPGGVRVSIYTLGYFLGFCSADALARGAFIETVAAHPIEYLQYLVSPIMNVLTQNNGAYATYVLPQRQYVTAEAEGFAGFARLRSGPGSFAYSGEWVWRPGMDFFELAFPLLNSLKFLTLPATVWALWRRQWFFTTCAIMLLTLAFFTSALDVPEARLYMLGYPLWGVVLGGAAVWVVRLFTSRLRAKHALETSETGI